MKDPILEIMLSLNLMENRIYSFYDGALQLQLAIYSS